MAGLVGSTRTAKRSAFGRRSCNSPSCLAPSSAAIDVTPVTLPPGQFRLATRPDRTGSPPVVKTIGIVAVAALAAETAAKPGTTMTATRRRTNSAANSGIRSNALRAKRYFNGDVAAIHEAGFAEAFAECR